ncbi:hypothetical protein OESDEN_07976 [Oesophagostomum dentatum]|uniref:Uncharacterized protein n=1 Tax=Oesophagostomum dentatum TaxID=61180 RepID=A0A0B1RX17_OESDE|nr:hypothetical protein OESDEN_24637 [Oesophagostomum dentatum]KHJ92144.1 hypothetical protein OESDEN_07976 [Oesophagostomum dentatum]
MKLFFALLALICATFCETPLNASALSTSIDSVKQFNVTKEEGTRKQLIPAPKTPTFKALHTKSGKKLKQKVTKAINKLKDAFADASELLSDPKLTDADRAAALNKLQTENEALFQALESTLDENSDQNDAGSESRKSRRHKNREENEGEIEEDSSHSWERKGKEKYRRNGGKQKKSSKGRKAARFQRDDSD